MEPRSGEVVSLGGLEIQVEFYDASEQRIRATCTLDVESDGMERECTSFDIDSAKILKVEWFTKRQWVQLDEGISFGEDWLTYETSEDRTRFRAALLDSKGDIVDAAYAEIKNNV